MENKPKMYHNNSYKEFNNNRSVYTSYDRKIVNNLDNTSVRKKIDKIIKSNSFIYSKLVNIVIDNDIIKRKIIGFYNNNLLTTDNEYIPIESIKDIYI